MDVVYKLDVVLLFVVLITYFFYIY